MSWKLIIRGEAIEDITQAVEWYEQQRPLLGEEFTEEIDNALASIKTNPYLFQLHKKTIRHGLIKRFPYLIIYEIESRNIVVYAVLRAERHPKKRYTRTKK